jgi:hypothetical protein
MASTIFNLQNHEIPDPDGRENLGKLESRPLGSSIPLIYRSEDVGSDVHTNNRKSLIKLDINALTVS